MAKFYHIPFFLLAFLLMYDPSFLFSHGQLLPIVNEPRDNTSKAQIYIVHVLKPEGTDFLSAEELESWYKSFLPSTNLETGEPRLVYSYTHVMTGFAARLTSPEEVSAMEDMDGFVLAYPDREFELFTTYTPTLLGLDGWQSLWRNSSYGEGMIVGVIDSGILPTHPSFQDDGSMPAPPLKWRGRCDFRQGICNNKLIGAVAFKGGANPSPLDDIGHGTHVASTVAGSLVHDANVLGQAWGNAVGIAPRAHIAVYKVLFNNAGTHSDILAGINQAIADGVDVLQMSLGEVSLPLYEGVNRGSFAAIQRGIVPCAAAGNSGPSRSVIANDAPWVLTVGASTTDRRIKATVKLGDGTELNGESAYQPSGLLNQMPIVHPGANGAQGYRECSTLRGLDVRGKIVLCWGKAIGGNVPRGQVVQAAGGAAMIVVNDQVEALTTAAEAHILPAVHVSSRNALRILNYFATTFNPTATIEFKGTVFGVPGNPAVATFSSRGPSLVNGGIIKPDVIAPGVNILAAWPWEVGPNPTGATDTFNFLSGTSMATPHVSGIVALLKTIHPNWTPAAIKSAIMTTAHTLDFDGNNITDQYPDTAPASSYYAMGAGFVNPAAAADPGLVYDLDESEYIAYLCGAGFSDTEVTIIANRRIYCSSLFQITAEQLNYPSISLALGAGATKFIDRTVTNVGEANSVYNVQINEPGGVTVDVSPNQLSFSSVGEQQSYRIQFTATNAAQVPGLVARGQLSWVSNKHFVRSVMSVTFA